MLSYQIHSIETAPDKSKPLLELFIHAVGFVPNLAGAIANSPVLANSLLGLFQIVHGGSFTEAEVQVLLLTNAVTNSSSWPVAFQELRIETMFPTDEETEKEHLRLLGIVSA